MNRQRKLKVFLIVSAVLVVIYVGLTAMLMGQNDPDWQHKYTQFSKLKNEVLIVLIQNASRLELLKRQLYQAESATQDVRFRQVVQQVDNKLKYYQHQIEVVKSFRIDSPDALKNYERYQYRLDDLLEIESQYEQTLSDYQYLISQTLLDSPSINLVQPEASICFSSPCTD
ncbi:hypothetical protein TUMSATVNIG1_58120 (plasmid) [Vibrio nigripulchritudo]|uniref:hypothetical protein n=1 Tax=Vibrio nigripulchritudo TaxID=28173 RepID=UPI0019092794|nr:hypothetical protein [Vibrio nigripulchritudo]BCL73826.1 hypothetical protein VNTUMSATTG_57630 [Vibrio nigripulchritudo]BDU35203.1 hypothetical protein TUMSATVNIG1_58120 [Vibrio nigripulchritudo]